MDKDESLDRRKWSLHEAKSTIYIARVYGERKRNFVGQSFWVRGFFVSTVGRDATVIREYIQSQEAETTAWSN
jgi:putative transposase